MAGVLQRLLLVRDRVGIAPLFYRIGETDDEHQLIFGSEVKALLPALVRSPRVNRRALDQDLQLDAAPEGFMVLRDRQAFRATNLPRCVGGTVATPELEAWLSGDAGAFPRVDAGTWNLFGDRRVGPSCAVSPSGGAGPGVLLFAAVTLLTRRLLRRARR